MKYVLLKTLTRGKPEMIHNGKKPAVYNTWLSAVKAAKSARDLLSVDIDVCPIAEVILHTEWVEEDSK